jgi:hypothetical protein
MIEDCEEERVRWSGEAGGLDSEGRSDLGSEGRSDSSNKGSQCGGEMGVARGRGGREAEEIVVVTDIGAAIWERRVGSTGLAR